MQTSYRHHSSSGSALVPFWLNSIFMLSMLALCACSAPTRSSIKPEIESIKVVMDNNYPPYAFIDEKGKTVGMLIDQWELWEQKTGIRAEVTTMDWGEAVQRMVDGEFDVIDTFFYNESRAEVYDFSQPYADLEVPIFFHRNISGITDAASLRGFAVAVKSGDNAAEVLRRNGVDRLIEYNSYEAIVQAARDNEIVVFVMDKPPALYFLYKYNIQNEFNYSEPLYVGQFHRAVHKGNPELLSTIEAGFKKITPAEQASLENKWFGRVPFDIDFLRPVGMGAAAALLLAGAMAIWNRSLHRQVQKHTAELKALFAAMEDVVLVIDRNGRYLDVPSGASMHLSSPVPDIIGKRVSDQLPPATAELILDHIQLAIRSKRPQIIEYCLTLMGREVWFAGTISPVDDYRALLVARNINGYKKAVAALQESENKFKLIFNAASDPILIHSMEGNLLEVNEVASQELGYRREELLLMNLADIIAPDCVSQMKEKTRNIHRDEPIIFETLVLTKDRQRIPTEMGVRLIDFQGAPAVQCIARDITKRMQDQQQIQVLNEELYIAYDATLKGWSTALEIRERETAGHSQRIVSLTVRLAEALGIGGMELVNIRRGALLHDIGKMGIPDSILLKPAPLTADEWVIMRQHPLYAYRLLADIPYLAPALDIPYRHHERWDGSGYPGGLKGEEIPLSARIFTVVDVWDALTSDRPYRPAWTEEAALNYLKEEAGKQFDPRIIEKFVEILYNRVSGASEQLQMNSKSTAEDNWY